ncbi:MAG: sigma-70 family RNA polymerase sigma factor [Proteobacteria bacterium]|nr:sigma-70 family RNA polymerase sigma factor [Pseudomonadota bacterium]
MATNLKLKESKRVRIQLRQSRGKKPGKVVKLFPANKKKIEVLSQEERDDLVVSHREQARKLARSILRKWHSRLDLQEVDSLVDLSLCEAVRRYNPAFGASFITFLYYHMRGNLIRAVTDAATQNMIPVTDAELEVSVNAEAGLNFGKATSIDVADALSSEHSPLPDESLFRKELVSLSDTACYKLDELEREVIQRIYLKEQQLIDVANQLGYSRCHISRVKKKALDTLYSDLATSLELEKKERSLDADDCLDEITPRRKVLRRRARIGAPARLLECTAV